ncbi:MAG: hypothetical protein R3B98_10120 [Hyphomonas sp.]|mgnify:CR=1 FL=1|nr:hypothetical protein [Hyphomonas sp.]MCB9960540.1 hypothetical protein [Hyphomonas sp.]MCB9972787.1 hypothetical protein [Hyphomonas sp.]HPE47606.1 hypothetical protein [Hyphomonas sp.]
MTWVVIGIFWAILLVAILSRGPLILYVLFGCFAFGTLAVVPPALTGGTTFVPAPFAALGLVAWSARKHGGVAGMVSVLTAPGGLLLLTLFVTFAATSGLFLPRLLEGQIYVIPVRGSENGLSLLAPSTQNITQGAYLVISLLAAVGAWAAARTRPAETYRAAVVGGMIVVATGIADMILGDSPLLAPFRTATYALNTAQNMQGVDRVVGLMSEPATFGSLCVSMAALIYFLSPGFDRPRPAVYVSALTTIALLAMAALSASSTAQVMLGVFGLLATVSALYAMVVHKQRLSRASILSSIFIASMGIAGVVFLLAFMPRTVQPILDLLNTLLVEKTQSQSFEERSSWNVAAWDAFVASRGLGVGLGSCRASSWVLALLSNTGIAGTLLLAAFLGLLLMSKHQSATFRDRFRMRGAKLVLLVSMAGLTLSGTSADFGVFAAACMGFILAWKYPAADAQAQEADRARPATGVRPQVARPAAPRARSPAG